MKDIYRTLCILPCDWELEHEIVADVSVKDPVIGSWRTNIEGLDLEMHQHVDA